ncbi:PucR family transcriptional regulator [Zhihengliuella sp.]|uniref:PucR family transcriptional regulator n=1 Tax=Zhihengliuella sp. TaxID=1954483 RepID=UPI002811F3C8|nr:PucR family transcriptional regulator [Zhihengliuella sp.]
MITLGRILALERLSLEPVVRGDEGRAVSWVVTSELRDPTPYLNGGEVVLFTGVNSPGDDPADAPAWGEYVQRLADRGVVALGLGIGERLSWQRVPAALVAAVRGTGLSLFAVPEQTPFLGVIQVVAEHRAAEERTELEATLAHQRALTRAATAVEGTAEILRTLGGLLGDAWAGICTDDGEILEASTRRRPPLPAGRGLGELVDRLRRAGLRGSLGESGPWGTVVVHPLGVHGSPHGYLVVFLPGPADRQYTGAIATAVALLSLHVERTAEQELSRRRLRASAVDLVLEGQGRAAEAVLGVAGGPGWLRSDARVRVVRLRGEPAGVRQALRRIEAHAGRSGRPLLPASPATAEPGAPRGTAQAGSPADQGAATSDRGAATGDRPQGEDETAVLIRDDEPTLAILREIVEATGVRAGVGGAAALGDAPASHREAREALERASAYRPVESRDELAAGGVAGLLPPDSGRAWARELLEPLAGRGAEGARLLGTLRTFLGYNGNRRQTAAELSVHRNTLLHQLRTIEEALGGSLDDPQLRADLWIALRLVGDTARD